MSLITHAKEEMRRAGLYSEDSDYGGMIPQAVLALVEAHSKQGHSGGSHWLTLKVFNEVVNFKTLSPITNDPSEWMDVAEYAGPQNPAMWQSRRDPSLFSNDGGKTYYSVDDKVRVIHTAEDFKKRK